MFSARTRWNLAPNALAAAVAARRAAGLPLLDLTVTNPTRAELPVPADLLAPLADPRALVYEPAATGLPEARAAVSADYARRGLTVPPEHLVLTASTSEAYGFLFKLLCDPGDAVAVPRPSYPLFEYLAGLEEVRVAPYRLAWDGEWHLDLASLAQAGRPRAVVVVHPNNPTGSFLKEEEARALEDLCAERDMALIADEVFADFALREDPRRRPSFATGTGCLAFSLGGFSKSLALPQVKLGWIAVTGPPALRDQALARLEVVADTYLSVGTPVQMAAPALLARLPELQAPVQRRVRANLGRLAASLGPASPVSLLAPEGGWSAVLRVPATRSEDAWVQRLLEEDGVLVHPGWFFDFEHEAMLVLSLLAPEPVFAEGVTRLLRRVEAEAGVL